MKSFTSKQLHSFMERQYGAEHMVAVAAGDIKHDDFVREVEKSSAASAAAPKACRRNPHTMSAATIREDRDLMDAQVILGFEGRAYHVRDFYASQVLSMILGGGMSSRLFQEVREKRGLCYSVYAFHWGFSDTGIFGVHAATGQSDIAELVPVIIWELQKAGERSTSPNSPGARPVSRRPRDVGRERGKPGFADRAAIAPVRPSDTQGRAGRAASRRSAIERLTDLSSRLFSSKPTVTAVGPTVTLASYEAIPTRFPGRNAAARKLAV